MASFFLKPSSNSLVSPLIMENNDKPIATTTDNNFVNPIILPVINLSHQPEVLVFNVDDIKTLRNDYNILGVLMGTLQHYPQQNIFLSVPLKLIIWEVIWLLQYNKAILVDELTYREAKLKLLKGNIKNNNYQGNLITTPNSDNDYNLELAKHHQLRIHNYITNYLQDSSMSINKFITYYKYYSYLQNKGYFINPGIKFGGDLVIYPGDPLRYHSYSIVRFEFFDIHDIVVGGRLATSVKKNLVIMGYDKETDKVHQELNDEALCDLFDESVPLTFSIEWAGFG
ncbi:splicing endonuclease, putative [Candida dubliniensis CD36]|uniref:tRNA-splicing endonuclease subunit Sen34 n=1 Tax=Candida dubliniensis (strain CD36 / ATCC MYA-646 / CBS 7987 / NCPF 3949 / NRRL Y-17841) TaxID=573826 RepID=B9WBM0_CANDC|nr:splicing endonuclease, putative [Candida dubliniensis CD36]CAX43791.1 splicing endonuclease, putative [Candida dubliniensis CD36]